MTIHSTVPDTNTRQYQGWLTAALLLLLFFHPLLEGSRLGMLSLVMIGNLVVLAGIYAVSWNSHRLAAGLLLAVPSIVTTWSFFFRESLAIDIAQTCSTIIFFGYTLLTILQKVLRSRDVGIDELFGALNVYLLVGVTWGLIYALLDGLHPGAFELGGLPNYSSTFIYFSFSTLGTLGLGDVHPLHPIARSLTLIEMLVGLFFIAILFGRLVAVFQISAARPHKIVAIKPPFERSIKALRHLPAWSYVLLVAGANLITSVTNDKLQMPLFLDTWATSVGAIAGGLWIGTLGGVLYNLLMATFFWQHASWVWAFNSALVAMMTRTLWRRGLISINSPLSLIACGLTIALCNTILGAIIVNLAGLPPNETTLEIHKLVFSLTNNMYVANFVQQFTMESMDKSVCLVIAAVCVFAFEELRRPVAATDN